MNSRINPDWASEDNENDDLRLIESGADIADLSFRTTITKILNIRYNLVNDKNSISYKDKKFYFMSRTNLQGTFSDIICYALWGANPPVTINGKQVQPDGFYDGRPCELKFDMTSNESDLISNSLKKYGENAMVIIIRYSDEQIVSNFDLSTHTEWLEIISGITNNFQILKQNRYHFAVESVTRFKNVGQFQCRRVVGAGLEDYNCKTGRARIKNQGRVRDSLEKDLIEDKPEKRQSENANIKKDIMDKINAAGSSWFVKEGEKKNTLGIECQATKLPMTDFPMIRNKILEGFEPGQSMPNMIDYRFDVPDTPESHFINVLIKTIEEEKVMSSRSRRWTTRDKEEVINMLRSISKDVNEDKLREIMSRINELRQRMDNTTEASRQIKSQMTDLMANYDAECKETKPRESEKMRRQIDPNDRGITDYAKVCEYFRKTTLLVDVEKMKSEPVVDQRFICDFEDTEMEKFISGENDNEEYLKNMSMVVQEMNLSGTNKSGCTLSIKTIPHTKMILICRKSGKQIVGCLVFRNDEHELVDPDWELYSDGKVTLTRVFTLSSVKREVMLTADLRYEVMKHMFNEHCDDEIIKNQYLNLLTLILMTQSQKDSMNLSVARYMSMQKRNLNEYTTPLAMVISKGDLFVRSRLSLFIIKRYLRYVDWPVSSDWLTGKTLNDLNMRLSTMYMGNCYAKSEGPPSSSNREMYEKILDHLLYYERELKNGNIMDAYTEPKEYGRFKYSPSLVIEASRTTIEQMKINNQDILSIIENTFYELLNKCTTEDFCTGSASAVMRFKKAFAEVKNGKIVGLVNKNTRRKCIFTFSELINDPRGLRFDHIWEPDELLGKVIEPVVSLFRKLQLFGAREILTLEPIHRMLIKLLEVFSRAICTHMKQEYLTNGTSKEANLVNYERYISKISISNQRSAKQLNKYSSVMHIRETADAKRWCQNIRMPQLALMLQTMFLDTQFEPLVEVCCEILNLHTHKKFDIGNNMLNQIFHDKGEQKFREESINWLSKGYWEGNEIQKKEEVVFDVKTNMGQGILHYTSSLYHSVVKGYMVKRFEQLFVRRVSFKLFEIVTADRKHSNLKPIIRESDSYFKLFYMDKRFQELMEEVKTDRSLNARGRDVKLRKLNEERVRYADDLLAVKGFYDLSFQSMVATSSDDSALAFDMILITSSSTMLEYSEGLFSRMRNNMPKAFSNFYKKFGIEYSEEKSSMANPNVDYEFNSIFFSREKSSSVMLKFVWNTLTVNQFFDFFELSNRWYQSLSDVHKSGGSLMLCKKINDVQEKLHYRLLGQDLLNCFSEYRKSLDATPHFHVGYFEKPPREWMCGLLLFPMVHQAHCMTNAVAKRIDDRINRESPELMNFDHMPVTRSKLAWGQSKREARKRDDCDKLMFNIDKNKSLDEYMSENWQDVLSRSKNLKMRYLMRVMRFKQSNQYDVTMDNMMRMFMMVLGFPSIEIKHKITEGVNVSKRVSLFRLQFLTQNALNLEVPPLPYGINETAIRDLLELEVGNVFNSSEQGSFSRKFRADLRNIKTSIPVAEIMLKVWTGERLSNIEEEEYSKYKVMYPWLSDNIDEIVKNPSIRFDSRSQICNYLVNELPKTVTVQTKAILDSSSSFIDNMMSTISQFYEYRKVAVVKSSANVSNAEKSFATDIKICMKLANIDGNVMEHLRKIVKKEPLVEMDVYDPYYCKIELMKWLSKKEGNFSSISHEAYSSTTYPLVVRTSSLVLMMCGRSSIFMLGDEDKRSFRAAQIKVQIEEVDRKRMVRPFLKLMSYVDTTDCQGTTNMDLSLKTGFSGNIPVLVSPNNTANCWLLLRDLFVEGSVYFTLGKINTRVGKYNCINMKSSESSSPFMVDSEIHELTESNMDTIRKISRKYNCDSVRMNKDIVTRGFIEDSTIIFLDNNARDKLMLSLPHYDIKDSIEEFSFDDEDMEQMMTLQEAYEEFEYEDTDNPYENNDLSPLEKKLKIETSTFIDKQYSEATAGLNPLIKIKKSKNPIVVNVLKRHYGQDEEIEDTEY